MNYKTSIIKYIMRAIYYSNKLEIDANINELLSDLLNTDNDNTEEYWKNIKNSKIVEAIEYIDNNFLSLENIPKYNKELDDGIKEIKRIVDRFNYSFPLTNESFIQRIKKARRYSISKLRKILTYVANKKGIELINFSRRVYLIYGSVAQRQSACLLSKMSKYRNFPDPPI